MSRLIFTGTSSGYPSKARACSSFVIKHNGKIYQFDAGEGFSRSALVHKIATDDITKIFISHLHPDHVAGLFIELQKMYLDKRRRSLDIYVPAEGVDSLNKAVDMFYLFKEKFPFRFNFKPVKVGLTYRGNGLSVTAYPNKHFIHNAKLIKKSRKPNKMQSYSYLIKLPNRAVLYSGDLISGAEIADLIPKANIVIVEGMHIDPAPLFDLAIQHKLKRLIITHLPDKIIANPKSLLKLAAKHDFKRLTIAIDGLTINL